MLWQRDNYFGNRYIIYQLFGDSEYVFLVGLFLEYKVCVVSGGYIMLVLVLLFAFMRKKFFKTCSSFHGAPTVSKRRRPRLFCSLCVQDIWNLFSFFATTNVLNYVCFVQVCELIPRNYLCYVTECFILVLCYWLFSSMLDLI